MQGADGISLIKILLDEREAYSYHKLTLEAVRSILSNGNPSFFHRICFWSLKICVIGYQYPLYCQDVDLRRLYIEGAPTERLSGSSSFQDFSQSVLRQVSKATGISEELPILPATTEHAPRPLYLATASQIGLKANTNVPSLVNYLLPKRTSSIISRYLTEWLLVPPPYVIARHFQNVLHCLAFSDVELKSCQPLHYGALRVLLEKRQCNVPMFNDLRDNLSMILDTLLSTNKDLILITQHVGPIVAYSSKIALDLPQFRQDCQWLAARIDAYLPSKKDIQSKSSDPNFLVPSSYFDRETTVRDKIRMDVSPVVTDMFQRLDVAANRLCEVVYEDFGGLEASHNQMVDVLTVDINKKRKGLREETPFLSEDGTHGVAPREASKLKAVEAKGGRVSKNSFTSKRVEEAERHYLAEFERTERLVQSVLADLSQEVKFILVILFLMRAVRFWSFILQVFQKIHVVKQICHWNVIIQSAEAVSLPQNIFSWYIFVLIVLSSMRLHHSRSPGFFRSYSLTARKKVHRLLT